jgi:hypothetical protein
VSRALFFILVAAASVGACGKSETPEAPGATDPAPALASAPRSVAFAAASATVPPAVTQQEPPSEERAGQKAANEITKANYKSELTKIEKEIGGP